MSRELRLLAQALDPSLRRLSQELGVDLLGLDRVVHRGVSALLGTPHHRLGGLAHLLHSIGGRGHYGQPPHIVVASYNVSVSIYASHIEDLNF
jgi:hypothetical protein